jgi:hypothetical protein
MSQRHGSKGPSYRAAKKEPNNSEMSRMPRKLIDITTTRRFSEYGEPIA